jgi:general stress protein 26
MSESLPQRTVGRLRRLWTTIAASGEARALVRSPGHRQYQSMLDKTPQSGPGDWIKLGELIRGIGVALLTTVERDGRFHTRPVQTLRLEADRTLWFFTDWSSPKAAELDQDERVSLGYADPSKRVYIAVSGSGRLLRDTEKAKELWSIEQRAYYPIGPKDERLALLRVTIERAEYWIAPGRASYLLAAAAAAVTGTPAAVIGENQKIRDSGDAT